MDPGAVETHAGPAYAAFDRWREPWGLASGTRLIGLKTQLRLGASGRSPTKKLSIVKQRVRVHGRRLSWLLGWHCSVDRSVLGCVLRASAGVAERRRAGV